MMGARIGRLQFLDHGSLLEEGNAITENCLIAGIRFLRVFVIYKLLQFLLA